MITVADCEWVQTDWYGRCARLTGGEVWQDDGLDWVWMPHSRSLMLMFPTAADPSALARGVERGKRQDAKIVGAWLGLPAEDAVAGALSKAGFERGWAPWWMAAPMSAIFGPPDPRIVLEDDTAEYGEPEDRELLVLAQARPQVDWHAAARVDGRFAGRCWSHLAGQLVGIFDMAVWPRFQRRGLGTGLMRGVCAPAAAAGAEHAVLNATPEGEKLYLTMGFERLGDGITWWLHL